MVEELFPQATTTRKAVVEKIPQATKDESETNIRFS